jgi:hypothetical protein
MRASIAKILPILPTSQMKGKIPVFIDVLSRACAGRFKIVPPNPPKG